MTLAPIDDALDRLAPVQEFVPAWDDVLTRAGTTADLTAPTLRRIRRRRWILAIAVVAAILLPLAALAASQDWWFFKFGGAPAPATGVVVVKTGTWDGKNWELTAYRSGTDGICFAMTPITAGDAVNAGAAMSCDLIEGVPRTSQSKTYTPHAITFLSGSSSQEFPAYIAGPVIDSAEEVAIYFANGTMLRTATFDAPPSLGSAIRFYVSRLPPSVDLRAAPGSSFLQKLVGLDRNGRIVACLTFPMPEHGAPLSECR